MNIYLLRHAEAIERMEDSEDAVRWLTPKGRKSIVKAAGQLRKLHVRPELVVTSPLVRAVQTAELCAAIIDCKALLQADAALAPEGNAERVSKLIRNLKKVDELMLVGHEPLLGLVAAELLGMPQPPVLGKASCLALELRGKAGKPAQFLWYAAAGKLNRSAKKFLASAAPPA